MTYCSTVGGITKPRLINYQMTLIVQFAIKRFISLECSGGILWTMLGKWSRVVSMSQRRAAV